MNRSGGVGVKEEGWRLSTLVNNVPKHTSCANKRHSACHAAFGRSRRYFDPCVKFISTSLGLTSVHRKASAYGRFGWPDLQDTMTKGSRIPFRIYVAKITSY